MMESGLSDGHPMGSLAAVVIGAIIGGIQLLSEGGVVDVRACDRGIKARTIAGWLPFREGDARVE